MGVLSFITRKQEEIKVKKAYKIVSDIFDKECAKHDGLIIHLTFDKNLTTGKRVYCSRFYNTKWSR